MTPSAPLKRALHSKSSCSYLVRLIVTSISLAFWSTVQSLFQVDCSNYPQAKKRGPFFCPKGYDPICGTDGVKYGNRCLRCSAIWESGTQLSMENEGECKSQVDPGYI
uniref:Kazal-like domain-containing protein n=1 Tax=Gopherus evgoodei TaxID=1825980 RepID=A0A8C4W775_9SAUR